MSNLDNEQKEQLQASEKGTRVSSSGEYDTPIDEEIRKTGVDVESDAEDTALPESPENDTVVGSPNQGTESR